jgi:peptide/nickel transport system substrate-binding protein
MNTKPRPSGDAPRNGWFARLLRSNMNHASGVSYPELSPDVTPRWPTRQQWRYFFGILSPAESWMIRCAAFLAILGTIFLFVRFLDRHITSVPKRGGSYTEAVFGEPQYINPLLAYANDVDLDLTKLLFRGLYQTNELGEVIHDLATHEEVADDGKTYVITIRQDAVWHDGTPITAEDVAFTIGALADPENQSPRMKDFSDVGVEIVDDHTVKFTLAKPYAPFLSTLTVGLLPLHIWGDIPPANIALAEYNRKPIGSGPYMFDSLTKDRRGLIKAYHLVRFDRYYGEQPYMDELTFRYYESSEEAFDAVKHRRADGLSFATSEHRAELEKYDIAMKNLRLPQYTAVFLNQRNPLLKEKVVRQVLERAIDKNAIVQQALGGAGEPIHAPILPAALGYNPGILGLAFDVDAAKKVLDDAGWSLAAGDSVRKKDGKELRFSLSTVDRPEYTVTAEMLRAFWEEVGITIEIRLYTSTDIVKKVVKPRDYEALLFGEIVGVDPDPYPFWHSSQSFDPGLNLALYYNKEADKLLEEARQTNNLDQRREKYIQFQSILAEDQPAVFLYNPLYAYALPKKIRGYTIERISVPSDRFNGIETWYVKTRHVWQ